MMMMECRHVPHWWTEDKSRLSHRVGRRSNLRHKGTHSTPLATAEKKIPGSLIDLERTRPNGKPKPAR